MNHQGKIIGVDMTVPQPLSATTTSFTRKQMLMPCPLTGCCTKRHYEFSAPPQLFFAQAPPTLETHSGDWEYPNCCTRACGWLACKPMYSTVAFSSKAGPDFVSKFTVKCWRYCCCPCLDICETCCTCAQSCGKRHEILEKGTGGREDSIIGDIVHPTCWDMCCMCCFPGKNRVLLKTRARDPSGNYTEQYYVRDDRTFVFKKYPITLPDKQDVIAWLTINAQKAWLCGGFCCMYCGHKKTAMIEIDHIAGLPFNERAHLMAAAMKIDETDFIPAVGCCCNAP